MFDSPPDAPSYFNPGKLRLTGWWRAPFNGSPFPAVLSNGPSQGYPLAEGTNPPTPGATVNGYAPAVFNGSTTILGNPSDVINTFVTPTAASGFLLIKPNTAAADAGAGNRISNPGLIGMNTGNTTWSVGYSDAGATMAFYDTTNAYQEVAVTTPTGSWSLVVWAWNGSQISIRNAGASQSNGLGLVLQNFGVCDLIVGRNFATAYYDGQILEIGIANTNIIDLNSTNLKTYCNKRYGLSLS